MENKTIVKADIAYKPSIVALIIYYLAILSGCFFGFHIVDKTYYDLQLLSYGKKELWGSKIYKWYSFELGYRDASGGRFHENEDVIIALIIVVVVAVLIPVIIMLIHRYQSKITVLTVTEKGVTGSYNSLLAQVSVNTPIEHIDSITKSHGILDSLRGGSTVHVHSNSGAVGFHYVQNADEVITKTMDYIDNLKG